MYISRVTIRNYRSFRSASLVLKKGVNTLIGENGSGKSNALSAIRLLLDDSLSRRATSLAETDFNRALGGWRGHWIIISLDFEELDSSEGFQLLRHQVGNPSGKLAGTLTLQFRPKKDVRERLFLLASGPRKQEAQAARDSLTASDYEPVVTARAGADFASAAIYARIVGDPSKLVFSDPSKDDVGLLGVPIPQGQVLREIACTYIPALRDAVLELRAYRNNPLLSLLRDGQNAIDPTEAATLTGLVSNLNSSISGLAGVKRITEGLQTSLSGAVGYSYSPAISIESSIPDDIERLLGRLEVRAGDNDSAFKSDLTDVGLGAANLLFIAIKLLQYETKLSTDRAAHFLLIEEPEAHIHPHIQKTLFERQANSRTQVIVTTHSVHLSAASKVGSINVLAKRPSQAIAFQPANGLDERQCQRIERYLDAVRSALLFAKGVILVEGEAELIVVHRLIKAVLGLSPDELGISVISMDTAFFDTLGVLFHADRLQRKCAIVTDEDRSLITLPSDERDDTVDQRHFRKSAKAGALRREKLEAAQGPYLRPFFATHTFEADFLAAGNSVECIATLPDIYSRKAEKDASAARLAGPEGQLEALRLAGVMGKGWFALLLAEHLDAATCLPKYIRDAVAFACSDHLTRTVLRGAGVYRLKRPEIAFPLGEADLAAILKLPDDEFLPAFEAAFPDDEISLLAEAARSFGANV